MSDVIFPIVCYYPCGDVVVEYHIDAADKCSEYELLENNILRETDRDWFYDYYLNKRDAQNELKAQLELKLSTTELAFKRLQQAYNRLINQINEK